MKSKDVTAYLRHQPFNGADPRRPDYLQYAMFVKNTTHDFEKKPTEVSKIHGQQGTGAITQELKAELRK